MQWLKWFKELLPYYGVDRRNMPFQGGIFHGRIYRDVAARDDLKISHCDDDSIVIRFNIVKTLGYNYEWRDLSWEYHGEVRYSLGDNP